ncbi:MAG: DUF3106 domain-containing protein [Candidatus Acidiferrales bacterium]
MSGRVKLLALLVAGLFLGLAGELPAQQRERQGHQGQKRPGMHQRQGQQRSARALFRRLAQLPPQQQQPALESDEHFRQMPPAAQERFRRRLAEFNALPAERRQAMLEQLERGGGPERGEALFLRLAPLPGEEQERALEGDEFFQSLPPQAQRRFRRRLEEFRSRPSEEQQRMLERLERFSELPPEEQDLLRQRAQRFAEMNPQQRQQARRLFAAWRGLPPERRQLLMERLRRLQESPPEDRPGMLEDPKFLEPFDAQEQRLLRGLWELRQAPRTEGSPPQ